MIKVALSLNSLVVYVTNIDYIPFHQTGHALALNITSTRISILGAKCKTEIHFLMFHNRLYHIY